MLDHFWLGEAQLAPIKPCFPMPHGVPRVDNCKLVSGLIHVIRNGLRWRDAPRAYGPHKTLYNKFIRWSKMSGFDRILPRWLHKRPAGSPDDPLSVILQITCRAMDATRLKAHRVACSLLKGGCSPRYWPLKGGLNSKLHAVCDGEGRPVRLLLTEGRQSDHKGAATLLPDLPAASALLGDNGYDSDACRTSRIEREITPCIPHERKA